MNGQCRSPVQLEKRRKKTLHQPVGWEVSDWLATKTQMSQITEQKIFRESVQQQQAVLSLEDIYVLGLMTCYVQTQTDRYVPRLDTRGYLSSRQIILNESGLFLGTTLGDVNELQCNQITRRCHFCGFCLEIYNNLRDCFQPRYHHGTQGWQCRSVHCFGSD